jgi:general secretion pathway protein E
MDSKKSVEAMADSQRKSLGEILVEEGMITAEQLRNALELQRRQGGKLGDILVKQGLLKPEQLAAAISVQLNMPLIDLKRHMIQPDALKLIPQEIAREHTLIPLDVIDNSLVVVMADPEDISVIERIMSSSKMSVKSALGISSDIQRAIDLNYKPGAEIEKQVAEFLPNLPKEAQVIPELGGSAPIVQILDLMLTQAVRLKASDVHIEPQKDRLRVRFRIDGVLRDVFSLPLSVSTPLTSRVKIMAGMNIADQRRPQDGQISIKVGVRDVDIRVATISAANGERATLRILDKSLPLLSLSNIGFSPDTLRKYQAMLKSPYGMILVGGPTGSGKTTTLYASVSSLNRNERNVMTIEDPIEYHFTDINQTQVNPKADITFANGLRAIMRHDPNIILIGEIRDKDTATIAVQAALTGHLVLSSIHANDAVGVFFRLIDLGIEPYLIASTLIGIAAQRMVRRICPHCHATYQPSAEEKKVYAEDMGEEPATLHRGEGCNLCSGTGYQGRTGIFELLVISEEIGRMLTSNVSIIDIRAQSVREGMATLKHDGMLKVRDGITTMSEVVQAALGPGAAISFFSDNSG